MKKTFVLIAFATLVSLGSFAQDSTGTPKSTTNMHKKRMHQKSSTDSTSNMSPGNGNMDQMPMDKKSNQRPSTTPTTDSTK